MHSSRMRTARSLTVYPSMLCSRGGAWSPEGCLVLGVCAWSWGGCLLWGVPGPGGVAWSWGAPGPGGGGVAWSQGVVSKHALRQNSEFLTHTSENVTLPQSSFAGGNNVSYACIPHDVFTLKLVLGVLTNAGRSHEII